MLESLPMHTGPMSCYTVSAITVMVSVGILFMSIYVRYNSNEFRRIEGWVKYEIDELKFSIDGHDEYIEETTAIIAKIHTDLAVQENSMEDIKGDISELKKDISEIKADIKILLQRE